MLSSGNTSNNAPGGRAGNRAKTADRANKPFKSLSTEEKKARKDQCSAFLRGAVNPARIKAELKPVPVPEQAMLLIENDVEWTSRSALLDFPYCPPKLPLFASKRPAAAVVVAVDDEDEEGASSSSSSARVGNDGHSDNPIGVV